jgi:hypothetical protein
MEEIYSFVDIIKSVPSKLQLLENIIAKILKQTVECAIFIREYTGHGFGGKYEAIGTDVLELNLVNRQSSETDLFRHWSGHGTSIKQVGCTQGVL